MQRETSLKSQSRGNQTFVGFKYLPGRKVPKGALVLSGVYSPYLTEHNAHTWRRVQRLAANDSVFSAERSISWLGMIGLGASSLLFAFCFSRRPDGFRTEALSLGAVVGRVGLPAAPEVGLSPASTAGCISPWEINAQRHVYGQIAPLQHWL